jgi:hypothetical protein
MTQYAPERVPMLSVRCAGPASPAEDRDASRAPLLRPVPGVPTAGYPTMGKRRSAVRRSSVACIVAVSSS